MKTYTANGLVQHMLRAEGSPRAAISQWRAEVGRSEKPRMETLLDATRGLFAMRDSIPSAAQWALRLCDYASNPKHGFSPIWRAVHVKAECCIALHDVAMARACLTKLETLAEESHEARIASQRLYQRLAGSERIVP